MHRFIAHCFCWIAEDAPATSSRLCGILVRVMPAATGMCEGDAGVAGSLRFGAYRPLACMDRHNGLAWKRMMHAKQTALPYPVKDEEMRKGADV